MAEDKYGKFHSLPVEEWASHTNGSDYKNYLKSTEKEKLSSKEKEDLERLEKYELESGKEDENSASFDPNSVDYEKIKSVYGVAGFLSMDGLPDFFLSESNLNTRNFVLSEFKKKSISKIAKEAQETVDKSGNGKKDDKKEDKKEEKQDEAQEKPEEKSEKQSKPTLFAVITKGFGGKNKSSTSNREINEENDLHATIERIVDENNKQLSNVSSEPISKETSEDLEKKAQQILDEEQQRQ